MRAYALWVVVIGLCVCAAILTACGGGDAPVNVSIEQQAVPPVIEPITQPGHVGHKKEH